MGVVTLGNSNRVELENSSIELAGVNVVTEIPISVNQDHGGLTGLSADDHPQYHNDARGDARYYAQGTSWDDIRIPATSTQTLGVSDPDFEVFRQDSGSTTTGVCSYFFATDVEEELFFTIQLPHNYELETDLKPHVHWAVDTYPGAGTVRWGLEYTIIKEDGVVEYTTIIYTSATDPTESFTRLTNSFTDIDGSSIDSLSCILMCRIFRDVSNDTFNQDAVLLEIDFHYQIDGLGSSEPFVK